MLETDPMEIAQGRRNFFKILSYRNFVREIFRLHRKIAIKFLSNAIVAL